MKRCATLTGALLLGFLLAACGPDDPMTGRAASDLPPGPLQPLPSEPATSDAPSCGALAVSRGETKSLGSDGDLLGIEFTNRGDAACTVHGYPTLTMRDSNGRNMGDRAKLSTNGAARYIVLNAGESATASVRFPKSDCTSGTVRIEVLIPGATERAFIPESHPYCPGWTVTAIQRATPND
jgi:hypothetical protein